MTTKPRLRRADSFFGIHYDFHCQTTDRDLGKRVTPAMVQAVIDRLKPDYIQIDCKGHPGVTSYPSRFGAQPRNFIRDPLKLWRRETARAGVALFMHYSGVWDTAAVTKHPAWAAYEKPGVRSRRITSLFGPYVDRLMLPQLLELAKDYSVDGMWVDGDCWATIRDYSTRALAAWQRAAGKKKAPTSPDDPDWHAFSEFCREAFRRYVQHYVSTMHREASGIQIISNWLYSSHMPETPQIEVDALSGDFWPHDSLNSARFEGRILAAQGMPWDLMSWGFATRSGDDFKHRTPKTTLQLQQEAALVLALGGGYQCYFNQHRDASISQHDLDLYAPVADFCRARQRVCHRTHSAAEVALLYSTSAFYREASALFAPWGGTADAYRGVLTALVEARIPVDAIHDGHLATASAQYKVIVVPEWSHLSPTARRQLLAFAQAGGQLLLVGLNTARLFARELGLKIGPDTDEQRRYWAVDNHTLAGLYGKFAKTIRAARGTQLSGRLYVEHDHAGESLPATATRALGRGRITAVLAPIGQRYLSGRDVSVRKGLHALLADLLPQPLVTVTGPGEVDVVPRRVGKQLRINLCNTGGSHVTTFTWDQLPPVGPLTLSVRLKKAPKAARLEPEGKTLRCRYTAGRVHIEVPAFAIHCVVTIDP